MKSTVDDAFLSRYRRLPERIRRQARKNYRLWKRNSNHPGLEFKLVCKDPRVYSVRVGIGWRALGLFDDTEIQWFWIGAHAEYDRMLKLL